MIEYGTNRFSPLIIIILSLIFYYRPDTIKKYNYYYYDRGEGGLRGGEEGK